MKKHGSLKQEPAAVAAEAVVPVVAVTPVAPVIKPTTPSDDISVDDFLGLGNSDELIIKFRVFAKIAVHQNAFK